MKTYTMLFLIFSLVICINAAAQTDLTGTWQGKLATSPNEKITIQFILTKQADGSYKAVVNSPDTGGIKNVPATGVKLANDKLSIEVASLSGSYSGTVGKGSITGEWKQQGSTIPLVLTPYKKPEVGTLKPLLGEWVGKLTPPGGSELTIVLRFEMTKEDKFAGFLDVPEQNAKGLIVSDVTLDGSQLSFKIPVAQIDYTGKLSGTSIAGNFKQGGIELKLDLSKGKYQVPPIEMPAEAMDKLMGKWAGRLDIPGDITYTIIFRFEKTKDGKFYAYGDCPERGSYGSRLADVVLKGDQFSFRLPAANGKFAGKLINDSISGTYEVGGKQHVLSVSRGAKFEAQIAQVDIPAETIKQLLGRWNGKLGTVSVIFRFVRNANGKTVILLDSPEQSVKDMPIIKASMVEGKLTLKMAGSEYSGKLNGNKIDGALKVIEQGVTIPLSVTKE